MRKAIVREGQPGRASASSWSAIVRVGGLVVGGVLVGGIPLGSCSSTEDDGEAIVINAAPSEPEAGEGAADEGASEAGGTAPDEEPQGGTGAGIDGGPLRRPLGGVRASELPPSFWAIEDGSFDLVEVSTATSEIITRVGGWGREAAEAEVPQALTSVEVAADGVRWLDDCCEPAAGTVFAIDGDGPVDLPDGAAQQRVGFAPQVSPSGSRVAIAGLDGVVVSSSGGGEAVDTGPIVDPFAEEFGQAEERVPVAWLSEQVVVVGIRGDGGTALVPVNVSGPEPVAAGAPVGVNGAVISGDVNSQGFLVLAVAEASDGSDLEGRVVDPEDGAVTASFALPQQTVQIDYDSTGTFLIVTTADGSVTWQGNGRTGTLGDGFVSVSW